MPSPARKAMRSERQVPTMSPAGSGQPAPTITVESVGQTLALLGAADRRTPTLALAVSLPVEAARRAVVTAPSVTARPDLFELLPEVLTEHLGGVAAGIRLVPLGPYDGSVDPSAEVRRLAEWIGQEVAIPLVELPVTADFVLAPMPWAVSAPNFPARTEPRWPVPPPPPPVPAPVPPSPPEQARPSPPVERPAAGAGLVHHRWPHLATLPNGGLLYLPARRPPRVWLPPRPVSRPPRDARVAVPARAADASGAAPAGPSPALPGVRTAAGWSFVAEPAMGDGPVLAGFLVEITVHVTGFRVDGRPVAPRSLAKLIARVRSGDPRPVVVVTDGVRVQGAAADLLFGGLADALDVPVYAADGTVSRTATGLLQTAGTFRRWAPRAPGHPAGTGRGRDQGPVLPARPSARSRWARPCPVPLDPGRGVLFSPARWIAAARPAPLDPPPLPVPPVPPVPTAPPLAATNAPQPASPVTATDTTPPAPPVPAPRWLVQEDIAQLLADRSALRQVLGGRYDAHARVVARTLAQSPGLRAVGGGSGELTAGLVALLAYCEREREPVNQMLRGGGPDAEVDRLALVARFAAYGLRRLPSVLGPVFRFGPANPGLAAGYRAGAVLNEPAFLDVDLAVAPASDQNSLRYAIWSVSAHRLDNLDSASRPTAVFPPGSRFQVLAVDDDTSGRGARILLRDLAASPRNGRDSVERILDRLRTTGQGDAPPGFTAVPLAFAPGLDDAGRPFPAPASTVGALSAREDGRT